jgi:hypothetical protein
VTHTHGTLGSRAGIRQSTRHDNFTHARIVTTGIYLHDHLLERKRELEKWFVDKARSDLKKLCDGSRRPVRGERHQLKQTRSWHAQAICPVC